MLHNAGLESRDFLGNSELLESNLCSKLRTDEILHGSIVLDSTCTKISKTTPQSAEIAQKLRPVSYTHLRAHET